MDKRSKKILTNVLGYPRIGANRELKKSLESFWKGDISKEQLAEAGRQQRLANWHLLRDAGIDLIPSNDFSFYDQVLDMALMMGAIPERYEDLCADKTELYFAMAHGIQKDGCDIIAMEMTKWFNTNYHYIVPEFTADQNFSLFDTKAVDEFVEALAEGIKTKPVLIGPVTFLLLGKEKDGGFNRLSLIDRLLPEYVKLINRLYREGAEWIQIDEPFLVTDLNEETRRAYRKAFRYIADNTRVKTLLTTYFGSIGDNEDLALSLPVTALHIDLVKGPEQSELIRKAPRELILSLGLIDGRNIWINNLEDSHQVAHHAICYRGGDNVILSTSCSLLHVPYDLEAETNEEVLPQNIKQYMAFARQKVDELVLLGKISEGMNSDEVIKRFVANQRINRQRAKETSIHDDNVARRMKAVREADYSRHSPFSRRIALQHAKLHLPLLPTTTIGSFPQTKEVRSWRASFRKGAITADEYTRLLKEETRRCVEWQEQAGLDVLVHGEFERNDMVEYFGEQLSGFTFTRKGWVQSYGSRCVKPPVIYGDVSRPRPMTVDWTTYAQSLTTKPMKGMLTGPVTILEWSFVRNDQPVEQTCRQIALAIRDEVRDLEKAGIGIIQIDEPAIREGLPLRRSQWDDHLRWAVDCFRLSASGVEDSTQIHTHMCYSEFNDIIEHIARMDADAITIECSRSQMELLDIFSTYKYPNEIGPGVYDIHSARVPGTEEMALLLEKASDLIPVERLWVNPDCGLKTRGWEETKAALINMIQAARQLRASMAEVCRTQFAATAK